MLHLAQHQSLGMKRQSYLSHLTLETVVLLAPSRLDDAVRLASKSRAAGGPSHVKQPVRRSLSGRRSVSGGSCALLCALSRGDRAADTHRGDGTRATDTVDH